MLHRQGGSQARIVPFAAVKASRVYPFIFVAVAVFLYLHKLTAMFYEIMFWVYFILASLLSTLYFLMQSDGEFLEVVLKSFAVGFVIAVVLNAIVKRLVHEWRWAKNVDGYREKYEMRKRS